MIHIRRQWPTLLLSLIFIFLFYETSSAGSLFKPAGSSVMVYKRGGKTFILNQSRITRWKLQRSIRKLSSGKRIVTAGDDPSGLAVVSRMKSLLQGLKRETMNAADYRNYLRYYDSIIAQNTRILRRIRQLILKSASFMLTRSDREINQREINQLLRQINMNARFSRFNTKLVIPSLTVKGLKLSSVNVVTNRYGSMKLVDAAMKRLQRLRTRAGVKSNILSFRIKGKSYYYVNLLQSMSRIEDLNMASEVRRHIKNSIILKTQYGLLFKKK